MQATILLIHRICVSLFVLSYLIRIVGLMGNIGAIQALYNKKIMRILVDMVISTLFLVTGVYLLLNMAGSQITTMLILKIALVLLSIPIAIVGFKKNKKALAALSVVMILGSYGLGEVNHRRPPVNKDLLAKAVSGKDGFEASQCKDCHGALGNEPVYGAKNLAESKLTEEEINNVISNGRNGMPPYKKQIGQEKIAAIAAYVKSLQK